MYPKILILIVRQMFGKFQWSNSQYSCLDYFGVIPLLKVVSRVSEVVLNSEQNSLSALPDWANKPSHWVVVTGPQWRALVHKRNLRAYYDGGKRGTSVGRGEGHAGGGHTFIHLFLYSRLSSNHRERWELELWTSLLALSSLLVSNCTRLFPAASNRNSDQLSYPQRNHDWED